MKKSKHPKKIVKNHTLEHHKDQVTAISSFKDQYLNADIGVRGSEVLISIGVDVNVQDYESQITPLIYSIILI